MYGIGFSVAQREEKHMNKEKKKAQIRRTIEALKEAPATSMMLAVSTGILRANLTRYLAKLEEQGRVIMIYEKPCKVTGYKAKYYSANPDHFSKEITPDLFPIEVPMP